MDPLLLWRQAWLCIPRFLGATSSHDASFYTKQWPKSPWGDKREAQGWFSYTPTTPAEENQIFNIHKSKENCQELQGELFYLGHWRKVCHLRSTFNKQRVLLALKNASRSLDLVEIAQEDWGPYTSNVYPGVLRQWSSFISTSPFRT